MTGPNSPRDDDREKGLEHLRNAAEDAADPDRLLPGEPASSDEPDDVELWIEVYTELLEYKDQLLAVTRDRLPTMRDEPARREVVETDAVVIEAERARFDRRLRFWEQRRDAAHGGSRDGGPA
ncbi:MAG TPA: hypothetical protein VOB72_20555 [Candidatus Dormibacteraeota bacterium]|nr:hypothetical protein [Candidatus Dormibacteraeota bacterium]